jgi:hypothetical protein
VKHAFLRKIRKNGRRNTSPTKKNLHPRTAGEGSPLPPQGNVSRETRLFLSVPPAATPFAPIVSRETHKNCSLFRLFTLFSLTEHAFYGIIEEKRPK